MPANSDSERLSTPASERPKVRYSVPLPNLDALARLSHLLDNRGQFRIELNERGRREAKARR
jgi:hypothetical protein